MVSLQARVEPEVFDGECGDGGGQQPGERDCDSDGTALGHKSPLNEKTL